MNLPLSGPGGTPTAVRLALALSVGLAICWAVQYPLWPLSGDAGFWLWGGEIITEGGLPYRDAWDIKGPLPFYVGAVAHAVFGRNEWGIRVVDLAWLLVGVVALGRIPGLRVPGLASSPAPLFFLFWYAALGPWRTAQPDAWAGILILLSVLLTSKDGVRPARTRLALGGAVVGAAALVKPTYSMFVLLPCLNAVGHSQDRRVRPLAAALVPVAGFALAVICACGALATVRVLDEFFDANLGYVLAAYRHSDAFDGSVVAGLAGNLRESPFLAAAPLSVLGLWMLRARRGRDALIVVVWMALVAVSVVIQGKYWLYHWLPVLMPMAIATGAGVQQACAWIVAPRAGAGLPLRVLAIAAVLAATTQALAAPLTQTIASASMLGGATRSGAIRMKDPRLQTGGPNSLGGIAAYLRRHTAPDQPVLALSNLVALNYLSDRRSPTRLGMTRALLDGGDNPYRQKYRAEFEEVIARTPPIYIVMPSPAVCASAMAGSFVWRNCLYDYPWLQRLVRADYLLETERAGLAIYRLRGADSGG